MKLKKILGPFQAVSLTLWLLFIYTSGNRPDFLQNGFMAITMFFGSLIAGATSEGGGAVAFPVMTLIYKISPMIARDFSLLIQSFGMTAASFIILKNKIPIAKDFLKMSIPGSFLGQLLTFGFLLGSFSPVFIKITFTSLWLSYGFILFLIKGETESHSTVSPSLSKSPLHLSLIFFFSFLGGAITALTGSGVDILTFSLATLFFGIGVKVATPTSVILMALNSVFGILLKHFLFGGVEQQAIDFWLVCLPVVIFGAPFGAVFISNKTSKVIIRFLQVSLLIQFIFSWVILPLTPFHKAWSLCLLLGGSLLFELLKRKGAFSKQN